MTAIEPHSKLNTLTPKRQDILYLLLLGGLSAAILISAAIQSTGYAYGTTDDYNHYLFAMK